MMFTIGFLTAMVIDAIVFVVLRKDYARVIAILNDRLG